MTQTTNTFRFYNEEPCIYSEQHIRLREVWCDTTITVEEKTNDNGKQYFDISYSFSYCRKVQIDECLECLCNPLLLMKGTTDGEKIVKNSFSSELVRYLMMDYEELQEFTGNSTAPDYKMRLMKIIQEFWD